MPEGCLRLLSCLHEGRVLISESAGQTKELLVAELNAQYEPRGIEHQISLCELGDLLNILAQNPTSDVPPTDAWGEVRQRRGQATYKAAMSQICGHHCALTGCTVPELLFASHAKPWGVSNDEERLDPYNGFLLEARFDSLFDKGLISFDDEGRVLISSFLDRESRSLLQLDHFNALNIPLNHRHFAYLCYHRTHIFRH